MANGAAFFDLDRTLITGSSAFALGVEAFRQGMADVSDIRRWGLSALSFLLTGDKNEGTSTNTQAEILARIKGAAVGDLEALGQAALPGLVTRVRPEARKLIAMHHDAGRDTWIVSASPQRIVEPLGAALGMSGAIGTEGEIVDGVFTGELVGEFIYGPGKANAISHLATHRDYDLTRSYAYSDSISDLPMLEVVGHPVAVNPDSELEDVAHERGWPIVIFARKTKRLVATSGVVVISATASVVAYSLGRRHGRTSTLAQAGLERIEG